MNDFGRISTTQLWEAIEHNAKEAQRRTDWVQYLDSIKILCALIDERVEVYQRQRHRDRLIREHRGEFALGDEAKAEAGVDSAPAGPLGHAASRSGGDRK